MSTIGNITLLLAADTANFTSGIRASTTAMNGLRSTAVSLYNQTRTPLESYQASVRKLGAIYRMGKVDQDTFQRGLQKLAQEFRQTQQASSLLGSAGLKQLASGLIGFAGPIGLAIVGIQGLEHAISGLAGLAGHGIKLAAEFEQAEVAFTTLFRSAGTAQQVIAELKQFAAETPFEFPELQAAGTKLAGFGVAAREIVPTMHLLGDIAAGVGANVGELAETYGKARIQGRAYTRDVNEFTNRGVPLWQALADVQHKSIDEIHAMVEAGQIGFPQIQEALKSLTAEGGQFEGGLAAQSKTLTGLASTLKDNVNLALAEFGTILIEELDLKGVLSNLIELTNNFQNYYDELRTAVQVTRETAEALYELDKAFGGPVSEIVNLISYIGAARDAIEDLQLAYAKFTGDEALIGTIEGSRRDKANPKAKAKQRTTPTTEAGGKGSDEAAAEKTADDVAKATEALRDQIGVLEHGAEAWAYIKFAREGATTAQLVEFAATQDQLQALKEDEKARKATAEAAQKQAQDLAGFTADLEKQIAAFNESTEAQKLWALEQKYGASEASECQRALVEQLETLREQKKALDESTKAQEKLKEEAKKVFEETRTPAEKAAAEWEKIRELYNEGLIDEDTAMRKYIQLEEDAGGGTPHAEKRENKTLLRGSSELFQEIQRANSGGKDNKEKIALDQLAIQRLIELHERDAAAALKDMAVYDG